MKRKIKLLSSIASLGLTLAIMTVGVLAAASHSLSVNNTISFNIGTNIAFDLTGSVYTPSSNDRDTLGSAVETYNGNINSVDVTTTTISDTWDTTGITLSQESDSVVWVFTVKNTGENTINVSVADSANLAMTGTDITNKNIVKDTGYSVNVSYANDTTTSNTQSAATDETITVTVTLRILDYSKTITDADFDFTLNIKDSTLA